MADYITLRQAVEIGLQLTDLQIERLVKMLGYRCKTKTKVKLEEGLRKIRQMPSDSRLDRVRIYHDYCEYVSGWNTSIEIIKVRELIIWGYFGRRRRYR